MKRIGKPVFFIVALLIVALTYFSFAGVHTKYGDTEDVIIKGANDIRWGIDIKGGVDVTFKPAGDIDANNNDLDSAAAIIKTRLVSQNITDYELYVDKNKDRIIVRYPWKAGEVDHDVKKAIEELGSTALLTFREGNEVDATTGKPTGDTEKNIILEGKSVVKATSEYNTQTKQYVVSLEFNDEGAKAFKEATTRLIGKYISIWMDETRISAATVNEAIEEGKAQISGSFTSQEANDLANKIQGGALPFKLEADTYGSIDPTLGEASKDAMVQSGLIAFILVCLFMILYYRLPGFVASIALLGQVAGSIAAITGFFAFIPSFTLTLPGIAGIILSIGMGVDANVITSERIKEEIRAGKTIDGSIDAGNDNSFSAIFDSNITVIIVAVILMGVFGPPGNIFGTILSPFLFMFGPAATGAVYSFGFTLLVGVILNFIMGVTASRLMLKSISGFKFFRKPWMFGGASK